MEGTRPILLEVQALVAQTNFGMARRTAAGTDYNRVNLLMAVLEKRCHYDLEYISLVASYCTMNLFWIDFATTSAHTNTLRQHMLNQPDGFPHIAYPVKRNPVHLLHFPRRHPAQWWPVPSKAHAPFCWRFRHWWPRPALAWPAGRPAFRSPSKYNTVSTICSSTRGPATSPLCFYRSAGIWPEPDIRCCIFPGRSPWR